MKNVEIQHELKKINSAEKNQLHSDFDALRNKFVDEHTPTE